MCFSAPLPHHLFLSERLILLTFLSYFETETRLTNVKSSAEGIRGELLQLIDLVLGFNSAICVFIHKFS